MEIPCITTPAIPPVLRPWSKNASNRCVCDEIPAYWKAYDVITFLVDLGIYHPYLYYVLDKHEKEQEQKFKTEYFKKRFTVSRSILKHILQPLLGAKDPSDILLGKEEKRRIRVHSRPDICISLSYSGSCIAITVGKQKIGSDIEVVRPVRDKKITSCPIFNNYHCMDDKEHVLQVVHIWTLVESYAKLYDKNPYTLLNTCSLFKEANFVSYCINQHSIFSLASGQEQFTDTLVWLDTSGIGNASHLPSRNHFTDSGY